MISQTAEYALRAVVYLATANRSPVSRNDIAAATCVPTDYLTKVLQELDRAEVVTAQRGPGGGYQLAVDPAATSVYEVINAFSGVPRIEKCPLDIENHVQLCPLHRRLDEAAAQVEKAFRDTKIIDLVRPQEAASCQFPARLSAIDNG